MAAIAFDTLQFVRRLKAAGVPEEQAEAQAEVMAEAFLHNLDNLVTRDYLDARLDARFAEQNARLDQRFARLESRVNLHSWMLGAIMAATVIPALYSLFNSAGG